MASQNPEIHTDEIALFSRPPVNVAGGQNIMA